MNINFDRALTEVLKHEGGYVNHPKDPGGATNLGVTIGTAKRLGIDVDGDGDTDIVDIKLLKPSDAAKVYRAEYWDKVAGDELPSGVDYAVFDFAVNSGVSRAAKYLQAVVGAAQDGEIGPKTLAAVKAMTPIDVINKLCDRRLVFLKNLSTWATFGRGWEKRVKGVRTVAMEMARKSPAETPKPAPAPSPPSGGEKPGDFEPPYTKPKWTLANWLRGLFFRETARQVVNSLPIPATAKASPMNTTLNKALVALVMSLLTLASIFLGWDFGVGEETVASIVAVLTPILVWLIPNKRV